MKANQNGTSREVMHVIDSFSGGGAEKTLLRLLDKTRVSGKQFPVIVVCNRGPLIEEYCKRGIPYVYLTEELSEHEEVLITKLQEIILRFQPKIVQTWLTNASHLMVMVTKQLQKKEYKLFWGVRDSLKDYLNDTMIQNFFYAKYVDQVIANSYAGKKAFSFMGMSPNSEIKVIQNGLEASAHKFNPESRKRIRKQFNLSEEDTLVICAARYHHMKGQNTLIMAQNLLNIIGVKRIKTCLIGRDMLGLKTNIQNIINLEQVDSIQDYFSAADIVICPSSCGEGFPNSLAEGMLCECIPITTDTGDSTLVVGDVGKVIVPHNYSALAKAIYEIATLSETEKRKIQKKARERIIKNFPMEKMIQEYEDFYKKNLQDLVREKTG